MSLHEKLVGGLLGLTALCLLLAVGLGLFVSMPDAMLRNDYVKALVPAVLVVLAVGWARMVHPEVRPN